MHYIFAIAFAEIVSPEESRLNNELLYPLSVSRQEYLKREFYEEGKSLG
jgi:hypothetical protein